jgi:hypothetical protein
MAAVCFRKKNSHPPVCGVHNVALVESKLPIDANAPHLGHVTGYVCPVSRQVVADAPAAAK